MDLPDFEYVDLVLMKCSASTSVSRVMFVLMKDVRLCTDGVLCEQSCLATLFTMLARLGFGLSTNETQARTMIRQICICWKYDQKKNWQAH